MEDKKIDLGGKFGDLTVIGRVSAAEAKRSKPRWVCLCSCGEESLVCSYRLGKGLSTRCNSCAKKASGVSQRTATHYHSRKVHGAWSSMKNRCKNPNYNGYSNYGGRGISYCDRWESFDVFIEDMGEPPTKGHSLDRIDCNGNYSKENCRWADSVTQSNNRTNNVKFEFDGRERTLAQWASEYGIDYEVLRARYHRGLNAEKILFVGDLNPSYTYITPNGEFDSIPSVCKAHSIPKSTAFNRFKSAKAVEWVKIKNNNDTE